MNEKFKKALKKLKKLNMPKDSYAIYGGGPLAIRGIRETNDLDVFVKDEVYESIKEKYEEKEENPHIEIENIEIFPSWNSLTENPEQIIENAEEIDGFKFMNLDDLVKWKKKYGREKDLKDINLIKTYIKREKKRERPYRVEPYNPEWKEKFKQQKQIIKEVFKDRAIEIEHIGSTSVPGIWAKPQIDILVIVESLKNFEDIIKEMEKRGYDYHKDFFTKHNERYFTKDSEKGERLFSIHTRDKSNPQSRSPIYFRNYLRTHPKERDRYSEVKRKAKKKQVDRVEYSKEKSNVLNDLLNKAENWHKNNEK